MFFCFILGNFFVRRQRSKEKHGTYVHRCFFQTWMSFFSWASEFCVFFRTWNRSRSLFLSAFKNGHFFPKKTAWVKKQAIKNGHTCAAGGCTLPCCFQSGLSAELFGECWTLPPVRAVAWKVMLNLNLPRSKLFGFSTQSESVFFLVVLGPRIWWINDGFWLPWFFFGGV